MTVPDIVCQEPLPVEKLLSERMPLKRLTIHLTSQPAVISRQMSDAIHTAILRSFEHRYHL